MVAHGRLSQTLSESCVWSNRDLGVRYCEVLEPFTRSPGDVGSVLMEATLAHFTVNRLFRADRGPRGFWLTLWCGSRGRGVQILVSSPSERWKQWQSPAPTLSQAPPPNQNPWPSGLGKHQDA